MKKWSLDDKITIPFIGTITRWWALIPVIIVIGTSIATGDYIQAASLFGLFIFAVIFGYLIS